jgi:hypothetical protein
MKKVIGICVFVSALGFGTITYGQNSVTSVEEKGKIELRKTGNRSNRLISKTGIELYTEKTGPNGETIFVDRRSRYYWVDKDKRRHYIKQSQLKTKDDGSWFKEGMRIV